STKVSSGHSLFCNSSRATSWFGRSSSTVSMATGWPSSRIRNPCFRSSPVCGSNSKDPKRYAIGFATFEANGHSQFFGSIALPPCFLQRFRFTNIAKSILLSELRRQQRFICVPLRRTTFPAILLRGFEEEQDQMRHFDLNCLLRFCRSVLIVVPF